MHYSHFEKKAYNLTLSQLIISELVQNYPQYDEMICDENEFTNILSKFTFLFIDNEQSHYKTMELYSHVFKKHLAETLKEYHTFNLLSAFDGYCCQKYR
jgi:hypothetical protein